MVTYESHSEDREERSKQVTAEWRMTWVPKYLVLPISISFTTCMIMNHVPDNFYRFLSPISELTLQVIGFHFIGSVFKMYSRGYKVVLI